MASLLIWNTLRIYPSGTISKYLSEPSRSFGTATPINAIIFYVLVFSSHHCVPISCLSFLKPDPKYGTKWNAIPWRKRVKVLLPVIYPQGTFKK